MAEQQAAFAYDEYIRGAILRSGVARKDSQQCYEAVIMYGNLMEQLVAAHLRFAALGMRWDTLDSETQQALRQLFEVPPGVQDATIEATFGCLDR
jgi:hypothetical protein